MAATSQQELTPFSWGEISLTQTTYVNGVPHPTRQAMGEWLEYDDPQKAIDNILARNPHIERHSIPLNLRALDGKMRDTLVYHPIGFLLIVMESGQPKAKAMKEAVAEFVWSFAGPRALSNKERMERMKHRRTLILDLCKTGDAAAREAFIADLSEVSLELGLPVPAALSVRQLSLPV
ncbi:MAG: hypothetical protein WC830_18225 [Burkholderiales bacterium]